MYCSISGALFVRHLGSQRGALWDAVRSVCFRWQMSLLTAVSLTMSAARTFAKGWSSIGTVQGWSNSIRCLPRLVCPRVKDRDPYRRAVKSKGQYLSLYRHPIEDRVGVAIVEKQLRILSQNKANGSRLLVSCQRPHVIVPRTKIFHYSLFRKSKRDNSENTEKSGPYSKHLTKVLPNPNQRPILTHVYFLVNQFQKGSLCICKRLLFFVDEQ